MENTKYKNFTLGLALFDALPVLFFSASMILIATHFKSTSFIIGAILCSLAGCGKVIWKIIVAARNKDIHVLNTQMRILMPVGFILMIIGVMLNRSHIHLQNAFTFPSILFFFITILGMICMSVFAAKLDSTKVKSNWIEQITNAIAQLSFLIGVIVTIL